MAQMPSLYAHAGMGGGSAGVPGRSKVTCLHRDVRVAYLGSSVSQPGGPFAYISCTCCCTARTWTRAAHARRVVNECPTAPLRRGAASCGIHIPRLPCDEPVVRADTPPSALCVAVTATPRPSATARDGRTTLGRGASMARRRFGQEQGRVGWSPWVHLPQRGGRFGIN